jgi:hypothetical protein
MPSILRAGGGTTTQQKADDKKNEKHRGQAGAKGEERIGDGSEKPSEQVDDHQSGRRSGACRHVDLA